VATGSAVPSSGMVTGTAFDTACVVTTGTGAPPPPPPRPDRPLPRPAPPPEASPAGCCAALGPESFEHAELEKPAKTREINANPRVRRGRKQKRAIMGMRKLTTLSSTLARTLKG